MSNPKITLVGAGGLSFGPTMVNDVIHTRVLAGSRLVLHDISEARLQRAYRFAAKLNAANGNPVILEQSTDPAEALTGADFVIASAEHGRFRYWRQDYEIPLRYGATQVNGENGGPGAVFHSLRSIRNTLCICANIEKCCPDAFLINLSNPTSRVTLAIDQGSKVRNALLRLHDRPLGVDQTGTVLEQWVILQVVQLGRALKKSWKISSYRSEAGAEVDLVVEGSFGTIGIEVKHSRNVSLRDTRGLTSLAEVVRGAKTFEKWIFYRGDRRQRFDNGVEAIPVLEGLRTLAEL